MYEVDEKNMTVKQVWQYGKELGLDFASFMGCTVYTYDNTIFINSAFVRKKENLRNTDGRVKEVDIATKEVLMDFYFTFKNTVKGVYHLWFDEIFDARILSLEEIEALKNSK